ncbi:hypothetical protein SAMN04488241_102403 [Sphingomonas rubra]|uniref:Uncharacterized protein n=1 Tax=Sphingomonas rubra TaxID=634430 RepID=A0A1I5QZN5_9SPHN|nr:hypothetical protein SAMN04488241_102403 [Sphingomonas rubra]
MPDFWAYAAFLANSCLFLLIGSHEAHQPIALVSLPLVGAIILTLIGRARQSIHFPYRSHDLGCGLRRFISIT